MKDHVLRNHYGEQLNELYPGQSCTICGKEFNMRVMYLRHLSNAHESLLETLLNNDGLELPPKSTEMKLDDPTPAPAVIKDDFYQCPKCSEKFIRRPNLKSHIARAHYKEKLSRTNPGTKCNICDEECNDQRGILKHITKKHEKVIQFLLNKEGLSLPVPENKANLMKTPQKNIEKLPHNDKNTENQHINTHDDNSETKSKKFKCPKCEHRSNNFCDMKVHIGLKHYKQKLLTTYPGKTCPMCEKESKTEINLLMHIVKKHRKILEFLLGKEGLSLPTGENDDIPTNPAPLEQSEKTSESQEESMSELWRYSCLFCSKDIAKSTSMAVRHYLAYHFKDNLKADSAGFKEYQCHICNHEATSSFFKSKPSVAYYMHLGRHPEIIDKYLKSCGFFNFSPSYSLDESEFKAKKLRVDVCHSSAAKKKARSLSVSESGDQEDLSPAVLSEPEPEPSLPLELLLKCFLCKKDFNGNGGVTGIPIL